MTFINQKQAAALLGLDDRSMSKIIPYLNGFPSGQSAGKPGSRKQYDKKAVIAWARNRDVAEEARQALAKYRSCTGADEETTRRLQLSRQFLSGAFDPKAKRQRHELRKLTARTLNPTTTRITPIHDWMND